MGAHRDTQYKGQKYLVGNDAAISLLRISPGMVPTARHDMLQNLLVNLRQLGVQGQGSLAHRIWLTAPLHFSRSAIAAAVLYQDLGMQSLWMVSHGLQCSQGRP